MAFRRLRSGRRGRRPVRRYRRRAIRIRSRRNIMNTRKYSFKFTSALSIVGDSNGLSENAFMINYPFQYYTGSGFAVMSDRSPAFANSEAMFSEYLVRGVKLRWVPRYTDSDVVGNAVAVSRVIVDPRTASIPSTLAKSANYPSFREFNSTKSFSMYVKNTTTRGWFYTTAHPADDPSTVGLQTPPNPLGSIGFSLQGPFASATTMGHWLITYYVTFRGIKTGQTAPSEFVDVPNQQAPPLELQPVRPVLKRGTSPISRIGSVSNSLK